MWRRISGITLLTIHSSRRDSVRCFRCASQSRALPFPGGFDTWLWEKCVIIPRCFLFSMVIPRLAFLRVHLQKRKGGNMLEWRDKWWRRVERVVNSSQHSSACVPTMRNSNGLVAAVGFRCEIENPHEELKSPATLALLRWSGGVYFSVWSCEVGSRNQEPLSSGLCLSAKIYILKNLSPYIYTFYKK